MHTVDRHSKSVSFLERQLYRQQKSHILWKSQLVIANITDAFQLILKANSSEKFMVENILNIWTSNEKKYWQNKKMRESINNHQSLYCKVDKIIKWHWMTYIELKFDQKW